jgi:hypothetical protein
MCICSPSLLTSASSTSPDFGRDFGPETMENMKDEVVTKISDSGDSMSIPHDGGVVLIPKPSADPRDPLVCTASSRVILSIMHKSQDTNQPFSAELATPKEGGHNCHPLAGAVRWICRPVLWSTQSDAAGCTVPQDRRSDYLLCKINVLDNSHQQSNRQSRILLLPRVSHPGASSSLLYRTSLVAPQSSSGPSLVASAPRYGAPR